MAVIATLLPHAGQEQRLRAAVRDRHQVVPCDNWAELTRVGERGEASVIVFDFYADGTVDFDRMRQLQRRAPRAALVIYSAVTPDRAQHMFEAGRCGIDGLVVYDETDAPSQMLALVEQAEARSVAAMLRAELVGTRSVVRDAVLICVARAHDRITADALARRVSLSRRMLARRLLEARLPPPQQLVTWGRLIVAARMLEDDRRSADSVARDLDFPSASAFRNTCQRYLGATPQQVRARGGSVWVAQRMLADAGASAELRPVQVA